MVSARATLPYVAGRGRARAVRRRRRVDRTGNAVSRYARRPEDEPLAGCAALDALSPAERAVRPLFGLTFAVKDNIDIAGWPTTAGCPGFAYLATRSATVVERLERAGAIPVGKTNMDQFATGL